MAANHHLEQPDITSNRIFVPWADTVARLVEMVRGQGHEGLRSVDQDAEARGVGQSSHETVLAIFGSPAAGALVMMAAPLSALDQPLKVLAWADDGQTMVTS